MAYATNSHSATHNGLAARFDAIIADIRGRSARRKIYKQTFRELASLSDRDLADLGLHRTEIRRISWQAAQEA